MCPPQCYVRFRVTLKAGDINVLREPRGQILWRWMKTAFHKRRLRDTLIQPTLLHAQTCHLIR